MAILKYKDVNGNWRILLGGTSSSDIIVDSVLSTESENPVQNKVITNTVMEISDYVDDIKARYLKSANLDSNALTLVNQDDVEIKFLSNPDNIVSTTEDGLVPKIENSNNDSISSPIDDWVLTSNKGSIPTWKRLPSIGDTSEFIQGFHHTTGTASGTRNINADNDPTVQDRSTNPNRYYGVETDSEGKLFVNVPWVQGEAGVANAIPTTFTWTNGSTEGPTGSLTGTDMSPVLFGAIPSASSSYSGIVTTGDQNFAGIKTFHSDIKLNSSKKVYFNYSSTYEGVSNYVAGSTTSNLALNGYGTITFAIAGETKFKLTSSALHPQTSGGITLGTTTYKFGNIYATSIGTSDYRCTYGYFSESVYAASGFYESSDERLKHILNPVKVNLDQLSKLRKVYFLWKEKPENSKQLGVIAQDVQKLYPELVSSDSETGLLSVAYDKLSVIALEAVDTLYKEHTRLKDRVDKLEKLLTNRGIL